MPNQAIISRVALPTGTYRTSALRTPHIQQWHVETLGSLDTVAFLTVQFVGLKIKAHSTISLQVHRNFLSYFISVIGLNMSMNAVKFSGDQLSQIMSRSSSNPYLAYLATSSSYIECRILVILHDVWKMHQ